MIRNRITLKQLEAFVLVIDTGSFRNAAQALGTTQPNVSARIAALEDTLQVVLMHRDAGSVRLTAQGERLLASARDVLRAGEAILETAGRPDLIADRMRLGVTELVACTWLHHFLRGFRAAYPGVKVELQVDLSREIDRALAAGELDLAIQNAPFRTSTGATIPVGRYDYCWVATPGLAAQIGPQPSLAELFEFTILTHARAAPASQELQQAAREAGLPLHQLVHCNSLAACAPMALDGIGIALLPRLLVRSDIASGALVELAGSWRPNPLDIQARFEPERAAPFLARAADIAVAIAAKYKSDLSSGPKI